MNDFILAGSMLQSSLAEMAEHHISYWGLMGYVGISLAILFGLLFAARSGFSSRYMTKPLAQAFEHLYLFMENLAVGIIGAHGRKYVPMLLVFWMVIFVSNFVSLFFAYAPTADISFNLGMAVMAITYVQYLGIKENGLKGHLSHFAGPKMGIALVAINVIVFCIEIISELMKNISLTLRLTGNIDGGHKVAEVMNGLGTNIIAGKFSIPFGAFLMPIKTLTCIVQALIFCLLWCVYISLVTHGDGHHHETAGESPAH